jgi:hypothetical protein
MTELLLTDAILPPRKFSVEQRIASPDFGPRLNIFLDGVEQRKVIAYDCDAGTVKRFKLDRDGKIMLNEKRDEALTEIVSGIVTVEWRQ